MRNILDLSVFEAATLDIRLPDGALVKLAKPTQMMVIRMMSLKDINTGDASKIMHGLNTMALDILNSNDEGRVFDMVYVNVLNTAMKTALIEAYSDFIKSVQSDPNS